MNLKNGMKLSPSLLLSKTKISHYPLDCVVDAWVHDYIPVIFSQTFSFATVFHFLMNFESKDDNKAINLLYCISNRVSTLDKNAVASFINSRRS